VRLTALWLLPSAAGEGAAAMPAAARRLPASPVSGFPPMELLTALLGLPRVHETRCAGLVPACNISGTSDAPAGNAFCLLGGGSSRSRWACFTGPEDSTSIPREAGSATRPCCVGMLASRGLL
jgi:hypothetical protein